MTKGQFDLSTPEGRLERGVYDEAVDPFITDEMKLSVDALVAEIKSEEFSEDKSG